MSKTSPPLAHFQVESDLHLEKGSLSYESFVLENKNNAPFLLLAGDIGRVMSNLKKPQQTDHLPRYRNWMQKTLASYDMIFLVSGNNDAKSFTIQDSMSRLKTFEQLRDPQDPRKRIIVLHNESFDMNSMGLAVTVIGMTLWSKIRLDASPATSDGGQIHGNNNLEHTRRYEESVAYLRAEVLRIRKEMPDNRIVIITHHAPMSRYMSRPSKEYFPQLKSPRNGRFSNFSSDILGGEGLEGLRLGDVWVCGHTHYSGDRMQDNVRVISNQRGGPLVDNPFTDTLWRNGEVSIRV